MLVRVLQGHSICYGGVWFNQGEILEVPHGTTFETNEPVHDKDGKHLGDRIVSQVETLPDPDLMDSEDDEKQMNEEG